MSEAACFDGRCGVCDWCLERDDGPADCPGGGIDDLCTWPDVEACGLCTLGINPDLLAAAAVTPRSKT